MSNVHFTGISKPGDVEDLQTEHPWWATATGPPRPRSATGCLPGPSAEHRHPPKRSRRGALHTNLPAFQVMVVVVMVLDKMRCDISLTVHLTCMYTWQIPTTPPIHFVAWKPPLLPLTSSHQKSLVLSPSNCRGYKCFAESNGERLTTWSLKLGDAHWWLEWACHDELFHTKSNRFQSKHRSSSHIATRSTTPSWVFVICL